MAKIKTSPAAMSAAPRLTIWRDVGLALVMAVGLSTVFLSPLRFSSSTTAVKSTAVTSGRILGNSITVPLTIPVTVRLWSSEWRTVTAPKYGTLTEALSQAAAASQSSFEYVSRGSSIYLQRYLGLSDDLSGRWEVRVNGVLVADLSARPLEQGNEVTLTRQPL